MKLPHIQPMEAPESQLLCEDPHYSLSTALPSGTRCPRHAVYFSCSALESLFLQEALLLFHGRGTFQWRSLSDLKVVCLLASGMLMLPDTQERHICIIHVHLYLVLCLCILKAISSQQYHQFQSNTAGVNFNLPPSIYVTLFSDSEQPCSLNPLFNLPPSAQSSLTSLKT